MVPRTRQEAQGTKYEGLWQTPEHWPENVHIIPLDGHDLLGADAENNLYWDGKRLVTKGTITFEGWTLFLAVVATTATVVAAAWPIVQHFALAGQ